MAWEQAATAGAGAILGLALQKSNDRRQIRQEQKLTDMQIKGSKELTDYNTEAGRRSQMKMWHDTNYGAQMGELQKAGLNPGLIYGMSGGGATTTGSGAATGSVGKGSAPTGGGEVMQSAGMALQLGILKAQKENIEADTRNKDADTTNKPKQGLILDADKELKDIQIKIQSVEEEIKTKTMNHAISSVMAKAREDIARMEVLETQAKVNKGTVNQQMGTVIANYTGALLRNNQIRKEMSLTDEKITQIQKEVGQMAQKLQNETDSVAASKALSEFQTSFGGQVGGVIGSLISLIPNLGTKKTSTTVTHKGGQNNTTIHKRQ